MSDFIPPLFATTCTLSLLEDGERVVLEMQHDSRDNAIQELFDSARAVGVELAEMHKIQWAGPEDLHYVLSAAAGASGVLVAVATLLEKWFHRNDGKSFYLKVGDLEVSTMGGAEPPTFDGILEALASLPPDSYKPPR